MRRPVGVHLFTPPAAAQARHVLDLLRQRPADVLVADTWWWR